MKKYMLIFAAAALILLLCACGSAPEEPIPTEVVTEASTEAVTEAPTEAVTEAPTEPITEPPTEIPTEPETEPATEPAAEIAASELPYLQKVSSPDQPIYAGPSYDSEFVGTVKEAGTYTIVEEKWDVEDNLWGRLKSGAGWIDLTEVRFCLQFPNALTAAYANDQLLQSGNFIHFDASFTDYPVQVVFRANEPLTNVVLFSMQLQETMELADEIYSLSRLDPGKPLVVDLDFPGDMTTYAIRYTDGNGDTFTYCICISGRNGALILYEYEP